MKFIFHSPQYLYLLLLLAPMVGLSIYSFYIRRRKLHRYASNPEMRTTLMPERVGRKRLMRDLMLILSFAALVIVLARPQMPGNKQEGEDRRGIEAMICIDVSNSMLCPDLAPSRLNFAKRSVQRLLERMQSDKVGLIVFAGKAYIQLPITTDLKTAQEFLANITPSMLSAQGTAIGEAISLGIQSFSSREDIGKTIIVMTDGEDHEGDAIESATAAAKQGIRVQVVGIGTAEGGPIPVADGQYLKDEDGQVVTTHFNSDMCRSIAEAGQGSFVTSTNQSDLVEALYQELDKLPKANTGRLDHSGYLELFEVWAWLALVLLVAECFIAERRNRILMKYNLFSHE